MKYLRIPALCVERNLRSSAIDTSVCVLKYCRALWLGDWIATYDRHGSDDPPIDERCRLLSNKAVVLTFINRV
jgi:hypothetical protein